MEASGQQPRAARGIGAGAAALFVALTAVYALSPVVNVGDARYTVLLAEHLRRHGDTSLERYFAAPIDPKRTPGVMPSMTEPPRRPDTPYQIEWHGERATLLYPHGTALLALPAVALLNAAGLSAIAPDGGYDRGGEERMQRILAAPLAAAIGALWFAIARRRGLGLAPSLALAAAIGLGTPVWSTFSRALWNHGAGVLVASLAIAELAAAADARRAPRATLLASLFGVGFFVRPTAAAPGLLVGLYLLAVHPRAALRYAVCGALWAAVFLGYEALVVGRSLPWYYTGSSLRGESQAAALAGQLLSPGRGLLVYAPIALCGPWLLLRHGAPRGWRALVALAAAAAAAQLAIPTWLPMWWGGASYGPRLASEALPWLALLALAGLRAAREPGAAQRVRHLEAALAGALLAWSIAMQAAGALSQESLRWNDAPRSVRDDPSRLWDWRDPPFLAWTASRAAAGAPPAARQEREQPGRPIALRYRAPRIRRARRSRSEGSWRSARSKRCTCSRCSCSPWPAACGPRRSPRWRRCAGRRPRRGSTTTRCPPSPSSSPPSTRPPSWTRASTTSRAPTTPPTGCASSSWTAARATAPPAACGPAPGATARCACWSCRTRAASPSRSARRWRRPPRSWSSSPTPTSRCRPTPSGVSSRRSAPTRASAPRAPGSCRRPRSPRSAPTGRS